MKNNYQQQLGKFLRHHWPQSVYENNYRESHRRALRQTYCTCALLFEQWQVDDLFDQLLVQFVAHTKADCWDINRYGKELPSFIEAQKTSVKADLFPWELLADVARLEFALTERYYGAPRQTLELELSQLQSLDIETYTLLMHRLQRQHPYVAFDPALLSQRTPSTLCYTLVIGISSHRRQPRLYLAPAENSKSTGSVESRNFCLAGESEQLSIDESARPAAP
ncbi:MAG: HvfC/BufC family peptide modification chaperone [Cellvibrionaceae bacterium]